MDTKKRSEDEASERNEVGLGDEAPKKKRKSEVTNEESSGDADMASRGVGNEVGL